MPLERLQKIIAAAGICSRRAAEELITAGRVRVNGPAITELGTKADPDKDEILVDGKPLRRATPHVYLMLNKPRGTVTTVDDPEGRPTVMEFLKHIKERIYPVGRLDFHSEGLLLFTNDGEFANRILSTGFGVNKTYWAKVHGTPDAEALQKLREGIMMDGRLTLPAEIRPLPSQGRGEDWRDAGKKRKVAAKSRKPRYESDDEDDHDDGNPWFEVVLQEGRQNQIRRMFELVGHPVRKLRRVRIGRLSLGPLKPGEFRHLLPGEVSQLMAGERENSMSAPRPHKTAADFRKRFSRAAEEASSAQAAEQPVDSSQGAESIPAASADTMPNREEQPVARRPFERRPERPPQSRFTERTTNRPERSRYERPQRSGFGERTPYRSDRPQGSRPSADRPRSDRPGGERTRTDFSRPKFPRQPSERSSSERPPFERRPYAGDRPERRPFGREGAERGRFGRDRENRPFTPRPPRSDSPSYSQGSASRSGSAPFGRPPSRGARPGAPPRGDDRRPDDRPREDRPMERSRPMRDRAPGDRSGAMEGRSGDRQRPIGGRPMGRPMGRTTGDRPQGRPMQPRGGDDRPREARPPGTRPFERRPFAPRPFQDRPGSDRPRGPRPFGGRPGGGNPPPRGPRTGPTGGPRTGPPKSGSRTDARSGSRLPNPRADRRPSGPRKPLPDEERS